MKKALCALCLTSCFIFSQNTQAKTNLEVLPSYNQWVNHANTLGKYWLHEDAKGTPIGNFPTWRCNDGSLRNQKLCTGETTLHGLEQFYDKDFLRMQSRQTFAYGALFNLTGNEEYLRLHQAGVKFLLEKAKDPQGGFYMYFKNGQKLNEKPLTRTTQDLSYALVGLAMNAYLTHDQKVIDTIISTQKYIYDTYYDKDKGLLRWVLEDTEYEKSSALELVAQLDQINAYLLLTWRLVPEAKLAEYSKVVLDTVKMINDNFYLKEQNRFYGCIDNDKCKNLLEGRHTDYGHTVKAFWMEYLAASMAGDKKLLHFAKQGIIDTLNKAKTKNLSSWFGSDNHDEASWWIYAELDQAALTLALTNDFDMVNTLYPWINDLTDFDNGELKADLKTHFWRNGFHSTEHALIGSILSNAIRFNQCQSQKCKALNQTTLYFAPVNPKDTNFTPYLYDSKVVEIKDYQSFIGVTFDKIDLPKLK